MEGKTWMLLPEGFRAAEFAKRYPLPTNLDELQRITAIPISTKKDCGSAYVRRAIRTFRQRARGISKLPADSVRFGQRLESIRQNYHQSLRDMKKEAQAAMDEVKQKAQEAVASLTDLFALGRKGIEGQMQSHLEHREWQGEIISAAAFRDCFRMVTQAVKGLGLPSEQRVEATQAIMDEVAAAVEGTRSAVALAPSTTEQPQ